MAEEELKIWFFDMLNSCYPVVHSDHPFVIYWFYDESYVRKIKLSKLSNKHAKLPTKVTGVCLFEQDKRNGYLWCDSDKIWDVFYNMFSNDYDRVQNLISVWLKEEFQLNKYKSCVSVGFDVYTPDDKLKLSVYKPQPVYTHGNIDSETMSKLSVYNMVVTNLSKYKK